MIDFFKTFLNIVIRVQALAQILLINQQFELFVDFSLLRKLTNSGVAAAAEEAGGAITLIFLRLVCKFLTPMLLPLSSFKDGEAEGFVFLRLVLKFDSAFWLGFGSFANISVGDGVFFRLAFQSFVLLSSFTSASCNFFFSDAKILSIALFFESDGELASSPNPFDLAVDAISPIRLEPTPIPVAYDFGLVIYDELPALVVAIDAGVCLYIPCMTSTDLGVSTRSILDRKSVSIFSINEPIFCI